MLGFFGRTRPSASQEKTFSSIVKPSKQSPETLRKRQNTRFTVKEVAQHNKRDDCWVIYEDKVFDVTSFVEKHPGGDIILSHAGVDATDIFDAFHAETTVKMLPAYEIGTVSDLTLSPSIKEHRELRRKLKTDQVFNSNKLFYVYKTLTNLTIVAISIFLLARFFDNTKTMNDPRNLAIMAASAFFMGLFWQQCGWLSHDFCHHQVFKNRSYNNFVVYILGNVFQGFSISWWKAKHNLHHALPNVAGFDPDIDTLPFLAWSDKLFDGELEGLPHFLIKHQYLFYIPLLLAARISWLIQSLLFAGSKSKAKIPDVGCLILHYIWIGFVSFYFLGFLQGIMYFGMCQAMTGLLLAGAFSLNHNGMDIIEKEKQPEFNELQIITGRDVLPGPFGIWHWFMGGLDMQVEHHLFPMIPRHNLRYVQKIVMPMAKKYNIKYHLTTFWSGTKELFQRLYNVSNCV